MSDPGWVQVHGELLELHERKAGTYGTEQDALANYTQTAARLGEPAEYVPLIRIMEKCERAINLIRAGRAADVKDWKDIAGLAIGAEALRRRT